MYAPFIRLGGYIANGMLDRAIDLFRQVQNPNEVIVVLLLNACAQLQTDEALRLVKQVASDMSQASHSNVYVMTSLLDALMKCGDITAAQLWFDASKTKLPPMFGAMMKGLLPHRVADQFDFLAQVTSPIICRTEPLISSNKFITPMSRSSLFYSMHARS